MVDRKKQRNKKRKQVKLTQEELVTAVNEKYKVKLEVKSEDSPCYSCLQATLNNNGYVSDEEINKQIPNIMDYYKKKTG